jgi:hypothetical protein
MLDPWYNKGFGEIRDDDHDFVLALLKQAVFVSEHIFLFCMSERRLGVRRISLDSIDVRCNDASGKLVSVLHKSTKAAEASIGDDLAQLRFELENASC